MVAKIILRDGRAQPLVTLLRSVAFERPTRRHFIHGFVQGDDDGGWEWFGHVTDAATNQPFRGFGIRFAKYFHAPANFGKKVPCFEF